MSEDVYTNGERAKKGSEVGGYVPASLPWYII